MKLKLLFTVACIFAYTFLNAQNCGNWTDISLPGTEQSLQTFTSCNQSIFAVSDYQLIVSHDSGNTWITCNTPGYTYSNFDPMPSIQYSSSNNTYYWSANGMIYKSTDGGVNWIDCLFGSGIQTLHHIYNDSLFFETTTSNYKVKISDIDQGGVGPTPVTNFRKFIRTSSNYFSYTYTGNSISLYRSSTSPYNGINITSNLPSATHFLNLIAQGDTLYIKDVIGKVYYWSFDQGNTWSVYHDYSTFGYFDSYMATTATNVYLFMVDSGSSSEVKTSSDGGLNWTYFGFSEYDSILTTTANCVFTNVILGNESKLVKLSGAISSIVTMPIIHDNSNIRYVKATSNDMLVFSNNVNGYKLYHSSNMGFSYEILDSSFANPSHTSALTSQAIFISFPGSSLASKRSFNHAQTWIDGPSYYNFIAQYDTVYGYKSGNNTYVYYSYDGGLTFDSTLASANIYSESAALKNGFITYDISNGNNFSYFNATTHATTNFTVNGFTGTAYFRAINFKNRVYLLTDDSTNIRIVYSNDGFQTVQTTNVLNTQPIFPEAVYVENGKMYVTYDGAYLVSTDGINFTEVLLSEPCIQTMVLNNGGTVIGRKYIYTSSIVVQDETFLYRKTFSDFCNPYFMVYPDTIQHHYFLVNMSSMDGTIVSHVWNWGDGSPEDSTMFPSHTYTQTGNYFISLTISDSAGFGCGMNQYTTINKENTAISIDVVAELPAYLLGLNPVENTSRLSISPNPCSGALSIHGSESAHVELWSITGEKVYDFGIRKNNDVIYFEELASGIYICKLINMQGDSKLLKVLKE